MLLGRKATNIQWNITDDELENIPYRIPRKKTLQGKNVQQRDKEEQSDYNNSNNYNN